jgi:hypothetical protein
MSSQATKLIQRQISSKAKIKPSQFQAKLNQAKLLNFRQDQAQSKPTKLVGFGQV